MPPSLRYKIYTGHGEYVGACVDLLHAAILVAGMPGGSTVRVGHKRSKTIWWGGEKIEHKSAGHIHEVMAAREKNGEWSPWADPEFRRRRGYDSED